MHRQLWSVLLHYLRFYVWIFIRRVFLSQRNHWYETDLFEPAELPSYRVFVANAKLLVGKWFIITGKSVNDNQINDSFWRNNFLNRLVFECYSALNIKCYYIINWYCLHVITFVIQFRSHFATICYVTFNWRIFGNY